MSGVRWEVCGQFVRTELNMANGTGGQIVAEVPLYADDPDAALRLIAATPDSHAANVRTVDALKVAFHIEPSWDDERIYDELPTSGVADAYFMARAAIAKAAGEPA